MKKLLLFILAGILCIKFACPQSYLPPSPDAAALGQYGEVPVSSYTGIPQISIPIITLKSRQLAVPVSLGYHAGGIKVEQIASSVGLGWTLNAGGLITRTVRGRPDDEGNGFLFDGSEDLPPRSPMPTLGEVEDYHLGIKDGEPDIFYYNFVGRSGNFILTPGQNYYVTPEEDIKINYYFDGYKIDKFIISTEDGTKYIFEDKEIVDADKGYLYKEGHTIILNDYTSTWYLSKIESADGTDEINFNYISYGCEIDLLNSEVLYYPNQDGAPDLGTIPHNNNMKYNGLHLNEINSNYFHLSTTDDGGPYYRCDLKKITGIPIPRRIESIEIGYVWPDDPDVYHVKSFDLEYTYSSATETDIDPESCSGGEGYADYRLILESITETDGTISKAPYVFYYYENYLLPDRKTSKSVDHWGYYNGKSNTTLIPPTTFVNYEDEEVTKGTADRSTVLGYARSGSLKKIEYPTGGSVEFIYQLNTCQSSLIEGGTTTKTVGGLRIGQQIINDDNGNISTITYNYNYSNDESSGKILSVYNYGEEQKVLFQGELYKYYVISSRSLYPLSTTYGGYVGYEYVTVDKGSDGKIQYRFVTPADYPDIYEAHTGPPGTDYCYFYKQSSNTVKLTAPYTLAWNNEWRRGQLREVIIFNESNNKIKQVDYTYKYEYPDDYDPSRIIYCLAEGASSTENYYKYYRTRTGYYRRSASLKETFYDPDDQNITSTKMVEYSYNSPNHLFPTNIKTTDGNNDYTIIKNKYIADYYPGAFDCGPNNTIATLQNKHIISPVIEQQVWRQDLSDPSYRLIAGTINYYCYLHNTTKPYKKYVLKTNQPITSGTFGEGYGYSGPYGSIISNQDYYEETVEYSTYDAFNNITKITPKNGNSTAFVWNYNNTLPIAKATIQNNQYIFVDNFADNLSKWFIINYDNNDTEFEISDEKLKLTNFASASNGECDMIYRKDDIENTSKVILEFDVTIANSNSWDLIIGMGGSSWGAGNGGSENAVWSAINNETWYFYSGSWYTIKSGLIIGKTYHFKIIADCSINKADFYVDDVLCYSQGNFRYTSSGIQKIAFGNYGYGSITTTWWIDNVKLYPANSIITTYDYTGSGNVSSITDVNNKTVYYEYDGLGRLIEVKDNDKNILKSYDYNFGN